MKSVSRGASRQGVLKNCFFKTVSRGASRHRLKKNFSDHLGFKNSPRGASDVMIRIVVYNQRSPLEYTVFRPFPRLVFGCINADFCVQGRIFQRFSSSTFFPLHHSRFLWFFRTFAPFFTEFDAIFAEFQERQQILQIFVKISLNFIRVSQSFNDSGLHGVGLRPKRF